MTLRLGVEVTADASGFRAGMNEAGRVVTGFGQDTTTAGAKVKTAIDEAVAASKRVTDATKAQTEAERVATGERERAIRSIREERQALAEYAAERARITQDVLNQRLGVRDSFGAAERAEDIAAYGRSMDDLRARFVPLFAVEQKRRELLTEISAAERAGALTVLEAADARDKVTVSMNAQAAAARALRAAVADQLVEEERAARRAMPNSAFQVDQRLGVRNDFGSAEREADIAAYGQRLDDLKSRYVPLFAIEQRRAAALEEIDHAQRAGAISAGEAATAAERVARAFEAETAAARAATAAMAEETDQRRRAAQAALPNSAAQINQRFGVRNDFGTAEREADVEAFGQSRDALRSKYDQRFADTRRLLGAIEEIREAERLGIFTSDQATAAIDRQRTAFLALARERRRDSIEGSRADRARNQNLLAQNFDVFTSLASGMNPLLIAAQQGPQYVQAYGGFKETLEAIKTAASGARLAIGGLTAATLVGGVAWNSYLTSVKEVETALDGVGRRSGTSSYELEGIAERGARAGDISIREARSIEAALLRIGSIGVELYEPLIARSKDLAATFGTDLAGAKDVMIQLFADPVRGAQLLHEQYRLIDGAQARYIQQLARHGDVGKAQVAMFDALNGRLADAGKATTLLGRAWNVVANAASDAGQKMGAAIDRAFSRETPEQELDRLKRERDGRGSFDPTLDVDLFGTRDARIQELERQIAEEKRGREAERIKGVRDLAVSEALKDAGRSPANDDYERRRELLETQSRLRKGLEQPDLAAGEQERIARALDATTRAIDTLIPAQDRKRALDELDLQIQQARDPISKAELVARRERIAIAGEEITTAEAAARVEAARSQAIRSAFGESRSRLTDMREETAARAAVNDAVAAGRIPAAEAEERMRSEIELRRLIIAQAKAEGDEKKELTLQSESLRNAYAASREEQARSAALRTIGGQRDELERARAELDLVMSSEAERRRQIAALDAEQTIRSSGLAGDGPEAARIRDNARAMADMTTEIERQRSAWEEVKGFGVRSIDAISDALAKGKLDAGSLIKSITDDFSREAMRMGFANPLKNALFGTNEPTLSDAGGILGRLFGGGGANPVGAAAKAAAVASAALMTVTASTVVVNGATAAPFASALGGVPSLASTGGVPTGAFSPAGVPSLTGVRGAFLDAVASVESGGRYDIRYGGLGSAGKTFDPAAGHPNVLEWTHGGLKSSAAGRYQITGSTFREFNGTGMSPAEQDRLAWDIASRRSGLGSDGLESYLQQRGLDRNLINKLGPTWQGFEHNPTKAMSAYERSLGSRGGDVGGIPVYEPPPVDTKQLQTSLDQLQQTTAAAATRLPDVATASQTAAGGLGEVGQSAGGLSNLFSRLGSGAGAAGGGGGGLLGNFFSTLFGGGGAPAAPTAAAVPTAPMAPAAPRAPVSPAAGGSFVRSFQVVNPPGRKLNASVEERENEDGSRDLKVVLGEMVAAELERGGSAPRKTMRDLYGVRPQPQSRGA